MSSKKELMHKINLAQVQLSKWKDKARVAHEELERINRQVMKFRTQVDNLNHALLFPDEDSVTIKKVMNLLWEETRGKTYDIASKYINSFEGMCHSGYNSKTNQVLLVACLERSTDVKELSKTIRKFIPYIKESYMNGSDVEVKTFSVMTLSGELVNVCLSDQGFVVNGSTTYSSAISENFKSLPACLKWIQTDYNLL